MYFVLASYVAPKYPKNLRDNHPFNHHKISLSPTSLFLWIILTIVLDTDQTQNDDVDENYEFEQVEEVEPNWEIVEILENTIKLKSRKNHHRTHNSVSRTAASLTVIVSTLFILVHL